MSDFALPRLRELWRRSRFDLGRRRRAPIDGRFQPYGHTLPDRYPWLFDFAKTALGGVPAPRLLSFGCSDGEEVLSLRSRFPSADIKGIDIDPANIGACVERPGVAGDGRLSFEIGSNTAAEPAAHYDAIFCLAVLCHGDLVFTGARRSNRHLRFEDFEGAVADFARCLKPGGLLFLHTTNFRFADTAAARDFEVVLEAPPEEMAPDLLFDPEGRLMRGERYLAVGFRKRAETAAIRRLAPVQQRYLTLALEIERRFEVSRWRSGDIDLWPPARMDLYLDMFRSNGGDTAAPASPFLARAAASLATPVTNAWKRRRDLDHRAPWPKPADAVLLGDGVSLDLIDGAWRDRHGEPVMAALERQGRSTFLMQPGGLARLPWVRPTFAANTIAARAALVAALDHGPPLDVPDHAAVLDFLRNEGVDAPPLAAVRLAKRARTIAAAAAAFQKMLRSVRPRLAFLVTSYAGLGHAFALACRREGVLSVDLQHCPQDGAHRAYRWSGLPERGYSTLPAVFWTWTPQDAAHIAAWAGGAEGWHTAVHGGHSQLTPFLDDLDPSTEAWDARFAAFGVGASFEREILVALQPIGGKRAIWEALAREIESAPANWRWWIRRHPSSTSSQDDEYRTLLALRRPNVVIEEASTLPLPALLRQMSVLVSLASGAAAEAAAFGVPALFLDDEALGTFASLIERGQAKLIEVADVAAHITACPPRPSRPDPKPPPPIAETLGRLDVMADAYRRLCRTNPSG